MMKKILTIALLLSVHFSFAQTNADLELMISKPGSGQSLLPGDTMMFQVRIINHGPDIITPEQDTIFIGTSTSPIATYVTDSILVNDTTVNLSLFYYINGGDSLQQITHCAWLMPLDQNLMDTNSLNDTACVTFTLLDSASVSISNASPKEMQKSIYPNPVQNLLTVPGSNFSARFSSVVKIYDLKGSLMFEEEVKGMPSNGLNLDVSRFPAGFYFLEVAHPDKKTTHKFIKK